MKVRGRVLKLKAILVFLLIVLLTAGVIACGDDGDDDDDDDDGGSNWKSVSDNENVITVEVPKSWKVEEKCDKDQNTDQLLVCTLMASPDIDNFKSEWDEGAADGLAIFISRADYLEQKQGITSNQGTLQYFNGKFQYGANCVLEKSEPITTEDGSTAIAARYGNCGQSDATVGVAGITSPNGAVLSGIFVKGVTLTNDQFDKIWDSIQFKTN